MTYSAAQARDIRLLALLRGGSFLGDAVALVALYLRLAPVGHAWAIAALAIAGSLPLVVFAPIAGHVVDRVPAKRMLVLLGLFEAAVCVGIGYWHGLAATLGLMAVLSCGIAFSMPGYSALIPSIAGNDNVARSQSMMQAVQGGASVLGPVLGGLLVGWSGQSWPLYLDAMSFALGSIGATMLRHDRRPSSRNTIEAVGSEPMTSGVTLIWNDGLLRPVIVTVMVFLLSLGITNVAEVFFVTQTLHGSATQYGLVGASFGLGTVAGALFSRRLAQGLVELARSLLITVVVVGIAIGVIGLVSKVILIYPFMTIAGLAAGIAQVAAVTLFTLRTPEPLRGRMFAALGAMTTASQIGAMTAGGLVLTVLAPRTVFQVGGGASALSVVILGPLALRASVKAHARGTDR